MSPDIAPSLSLEPLWASSTVSGDSNPRPGQPPTAVYFVNQLDVNIQVYWINYDDRRHLYATLKPGELKRQDTHVGHAWEVVSAYSRAIYLAVEDEASAIISKGAGFVLTHGPSPTNKLNPPTSSTESPLSTFKQGLKHGNFYKIANCQTNTILDLSGLDSVSIIGYASNGGDNQKWVLDSVPDNETSWTLRNKSNGAYLGLGLGVLPTSGACLSGVSTPFQWNICPAGDIDHKSADDVSYILVVPGDVGGLVADMYEGKPDNNTPVILWPAHGGKNQSWKFVRL